MARTSKKLRRAMGLWLILALLLVLLPSSASAQENTPKVFEFTSKAYGGVYGEKYQLNELRMLNAISSSGYLLIPKGSTIDCVSLIGDLDTVDDTYTAGTESLNPSDGYFELANFRGVDTKGAGACDVCSWIYWVLDNSGFDEAEGHKHVPHPKIPGVPESHSVSIFSTDPSQNIWMTNKLGYDAVLRWEVDAATNKVKFWVTQPGFESLTLPEQEAPTYEQTTYDELPFVYDQRAETAKHYTSKKDLLACHDMPKVDTIILHEALISSLGSQPVSYAESLDADFYGSKFTQNLNDPNNPNSGTWNRNGYHFIVSYRDDQGLEYVPVYQAQNLDCMSWGVGNDFNSHSIQIGIVGYPPHEAGDPVKFPNQYRTVLALVRVLMDQYGIPAENVVRHVDVGTHADPEAINIEQFRMDVTALQPQKYILNASPKTVRSVRNVSVGLIVVVVGALVGLSVLRRRDYWAYRKVIKTIGGAARVGAALILFMDEVALGLTRMERRRAMKAMFYGFRFAVVMTLCSLSMVLITDLNDKGVPPQRIIQELADASPMLDNYIVYTLGEVPNALVDLVTPDSPDGPTNPFTGTTYTTDTTYVGVYGAINGWGTLGETSSASEAVQRAISYVGAQNWLSGTVVPVVNVRYSNESMMTSIIEECRGKCVVLVDITPNQDVSGLIRTFAPMGDHVWIDIDLEHRGVKTQASEFNGWAKEYFDIRQANGFTGLGVFAFYDFRGDPWLTPPSEVVWSYGENSLVVPIFDGHCSGAPCKDSKWSATQRVLGNYSQAPAVGIMEFSTKWGCGSKYGDCGFSNQEYFEEFRPLIFMSQ